jgi:ABC-2 type transport system ATP-binding protein
VARRFDEIVAFAELEDFIDQQVKHYSSGMYVRLGFSVAVAVEPDVLLVDEVLAVGDEMFQRKCLERVRRFQREGRTIVVVTHNADSVREYCNRALVLDHGHLIADGEPGESIRTYREALLAAGRQVELVDSQYEGEPFQPTHQVRIVAVRVDHPGLVERGSMMPGDPLQVHVDFETQGWVDDVVFAFHVRDQDGRLIFGTNTELLGVDLGTLDGTGSVTFTVPSVPLLDGTYPFSIGVHTRDGGTVYDFTDAHFFEVMNPGRSIGSVHLGVLATLDEQATPPPPPGAPEPARPSRES